MPRHYVNPEAQCPFYHMEDAKSITCDGVGPSWTIKLSKAGKNGSAKGYKRKFCYNQWQDCPISEMLQKMLE